MLERGEGGTRDLAEAVRVYGVACRSGDALGCDRLQKLGER
jgi:TPR repeat protein